MDTQRKKYTCYLFSSELGTLLENGSTRIVAMLKPRKSLILLDATPYYHCVSRLLFFVVGMTCVERVMNTVDNG